MLHVASSVKCLIQKKSKLMSLTLLKAFMSQRYFKISDSVLIPSTESEIGKKSDKTVSFYWHKPDQKSIFNEETNDLP